jgi:hypothetical protein
MRSGADAVTEKALGPVGPTTLHRVQGVEAQLSRSKTRRIGILNGIENPLQILLAAANGLHSKPRTCATKHEIKVFSPRYSAAPVRNRQRLRSVASIGAFLVLVGVSGWGASALIRFVNNGYEVTGPAAVNALIDRIIGAESNNQFDATNKASSASGAGQFIEGTWLDLIRVHRPELARIRTKAETLELRREPKIAREMTARFVERNAALLKKRGLPVTASTVYLAHFAGGAGAVAILSADENADAAWIMAKADTKGRIKRDQIIKANPFLEHFSVRDLKRWADRKMQGPHLNLMKLAEGAANN